MLINNIVRTYKGFIAYQVVNKDLNINIKLFICI